MRNPDVVTVVIRSVNERTESLCKELILRQGLPEANLFITREVPFSAAMRRSFEIGIEQNRTWTFCVDADLLLRPGSIDTMVEYAEAQRSNVCEIQGYVMDKFFGGVRQAGNHLFRTALLPEVIRRIPVEGTDIRPERHTLGAMQRDGYPWLTVPCITGVHDHEQYYYDIYRKAFVQAVKHLDRAELFITLWQEKAETDRDFAVALKGFTDSIQNREPTYIDSSRQLYRDLFRKSGFEEKGPLETGDYTPEKIEQLIESWEYPDIYFRFFPARDGLDRQRAADLRRIKLSVKKRGVLKTGRLVLGELLGSAGRRLMRE